MWIVGTIKDKCGDEKKCPCQIWNEIIVSLIWVELFMQLSDKMTDHVITLFWEN